MDVYANIRKLRKKLRQIEHLEGIERDLTNEEVSKCIKKETIRDELLELLFDYNSQRATDVSETDFDTSVATSTDLSTTAPLYDTSPDVECDPTENMTSDYNTDLSPVNSNNSKQPEIKQEQRETLPVKRSGSPPRQSQPLESTGSRLVSEMTRQSPSPTKKSKIKKGDNNNIVRSQWNSKLFTVSVLDSHNDLITTVDCCDGVFVSASRDTTVKVWDLETLQELRSLGSHTGSVTDVVILPAKIARNLGSTVCISEDDHLILSGSTDCSLNVWSAKTGELLKSIYTYNPITKLAFYPDLSLIATASDGGKLELWNIDTKENVCSERAHSDSITGLCVSGGRIYTSCAVEGEIKVFEVRDGKLHCIYASESSHSLAGSPVTLRHVRSLGVRGDNIYYGDDGVNLKILAWKKGLVKKLANHKEEFGMTDAICCHGNMLLTSAYDLDNGQGYVNVFDLSAEPAYITTLDNDDTRRILDICCHSNSTGSVTIVTAGLDLQVWKQVSPSSNNEETIGSKFIQTLSQFARDSDIESDVEFTDTESEGGSRHGSRRGSSQSHNAGWMSWCTLT